MHFLLPYQQCVGRCNTFVTKHLLLLYQSIFFEFRTVPLLPTKWYPLRFTIDSSSPFVVIIPINTCQIRRVDNNRYISKKNNFGMIWINERGIIRVTALIAINCVYISELTKEINDTIYVLMWTNPNQDSYLQMKMGKQSFADKHCEFQNCFLTDNFGVHLAETNFGAILFYSEELRKDPYLPMPTERNFEQKYVFVSTKPSALFPITTYYDNFFNWTWTYKLDSDIVVANIVIRNERGHIIGPKKDMYWIPIENMKPASADIVNILKGKSTAVAWYVSNCTLMDPHDAFVFALRNELKKHGHSLHTLGSQCRRNDRNMVFCITGNEAECFDLIESKYYFHLSFEDAMSDDYVTNKLLVALNNYAVPIVFGGANYTRYLYKNA